MRAMAMVGTLTCLLLMAACGSPQNLNGDAAPAGSPDQTSSASPTTPASSPPSTPPSQAPSSAINGSLVLGPNGIGSLKLGMGRQQALNTGLLLGYDNNESGCEETHLRGAPTGKGIVLYSQALGIAVIDAYGSVKTPQGLRIGMSSAEMLRIYPDWSVANGDSTNGRGSVSAPGNDKAVYRIEMVNGTVISVTLQFRNQDCYE